MSAAEEDEAARDKPKTAVPAGKKRCGGVQRSARMWAAATLGNRRRAPSESPFKVWLARYLSCLTPHRKKVRPEDKARAAKFRRGDAVATSKLTDKKLRGRLRHSEALVREAAESAAAADAWLLPQDAGALEAEGMERTWRFKQDEIVQGAPLPLQCRASRFGMLLGLRRLGSIIMHRTNAPSAWLHSPTHGHEGLSQQNRLLMTLFGLRRGGGGRRAQGV